MDVRADKGILYSDTPRSERRMFVSIPQDCVDHARLGAHVQRRHSRESFAPPVGRPPHRRIRSKVHPHCPRCRPSHRGSVWVEYLRLTLCSVWVEYRRLTRVTLCSVWVEYRRLTRVTRGSVWVKFKLNG